MLFLARFLGFGGWIAEALVATNVAASNAHLFWTESREAAMAIASNPHANRLLDAFDVLLCRAWEYPFSGFQGQAVFREKGTSFLLLHGAPLVDSILTGCWSCLPDGFRRDGRGGCDGSGSTREIKSTIILFISVGDISVAYLEGAAAVTVAVGAVVVEAFCLFESPVISARLEIEFLFDRDPPFKTVFMRFIYLEMPSSFDATDLAGAVDSDILKQSRRRQ